MNLEQEFNVAATEQNTSSRRDLSDIDWRSNITPSILPVYPSQEYELQTPQRLRLSIEEAFESIMADPVYYARFRARVEENNERERLQTIEMKEAKVQARTDLVRERLERAEAEARRDAAQRISSSWYPDSFPKDNNEDDKDIYNPGIQWPTDVIGKKKRESKGFNPLDYSSRKSSHVDQEEHVKDLSDISDSDDEKDEQRSTHYINNLKSNNRSVDPSAISIDTLAIAMRQASIAGPILSSLNIGDIKAWIQLYHTYEIQSIKPLDMAW